MSTTEGSFETEGQFLASHRKILRDDARIAAQVIGIIVLVVSAILLAAQIKKYVDRRRRK